MYAARKVLDALGNMFVNAKSVMDWLNECARDIAQHGASGTADARKLMLTLIRTRTTRLPESSVRWTTPVGLPVVQVCFAARDVAHRVPSAIPRSRTASAASAACRRCCRRLLSRAFRAPRCLTRPYLTTRARTWFYRVQADYLPVIKTKQRTAFPPNYIHSLDSAHMMLTAIACSKAGECISAHLTGCVTDCGSQASRLRACMTPSGHMPQGAS